MGAERGVGLGVAHEPSPTGTDASLQHVLDRLHFIEQRVRTELARRRAESSGEEQDRFRGLYVSEERVDELLASGAPAPVGLDVAAARLLAQAEARADAAEAEGDVLRLRGLARSFHLDATDVELLLIAAAPDVDPRFEPLYGYLNDDVSQRRATVGLALQLTGLASSSGAARARLGAQGPLRRSGLLSLVTDDRPTLTRSLQVADRVLAHLLGDDAIDPVLAPYERLITPVDGPAARYLVGAMRAGSRCAYLRERQGAAARAEAVGALRQVGRAVLVLDLDRAPAEIDVAELAMAATREARLRDGGLVVGPIDAVATRDASLIASFVDTPATVVLHGRIPWDPRWADAVPVAVDADRVDSGQLTQLWVRALDGALADEVDPAQATAHFRLDPAQVERAAHAAREHAAASGRPVSAADLQLGARAQNAAGLDRLARRIEPTVGWDELVLPTEVEAQLRELASRWRHRDTVLEGWGMQRGGGRGRGVSALFAGSSGTGKTMATEVLAGELGLDLYVIDLSTVVDKYIGETSKNLERIFDEADRVNGVLLFDEADALFGKRSAVSDAKDRHANVEVAFLLQRMESFDGVAILTTNLAANLDEAFMRRLDAIVDFPPPDEDQRRALWRAKLHDTLPLADDVDVDLLALNFRLSGSEIRNVVISAAYRAAATGEQITMAELVRATIREHRKIGRHLSRADLGPFAELLGPEG